MQFTPSFHAQHSPMGAHSSFTIGMASTPRGMTLECDYRWGADAFQALGLTLKVLTPFFLIPAPNVAGQSTLKFASCPATFLSFVIGNDSDAEWGGANCEAGRSWFRIE